MHLSSRFCGWVQSNATLVAYLSQLSEKYSTISCVKRVCDRLIYLRVGCQYYWCCIAAVIAQFICLNLGEKLIYSWGT